MLLTGISVVAALCGLSGLFWSLVVLRTRARIRETPFRIAPGADDAALALRTTVVVPARNEEAHIERCVRALLDEDDPRLTVIVLDDGSTDRTGAILADLSATTERLRVLEGGGEPLPAGWLGKPWACQRAGEQALRDGAECLLFIDADVCVSPGAIRAAVGELQAHQLSLLSVMGTLELRSFWERVVQPAVIGLILAGNDLERVNDPARRPSRPLANGQFMLFRAEAWHALGGHGAVRGEIIDDVGLATSMVAHGGAYRLLFGPKMFSCRMYSGLAEIWAGWSKNLFEGMGSSWATVAGLVVFVFCNILLPWVVLPVATFAGSWELVGLAGLAVAAQVAARVQLDRRFGQDARYAVTIPLGWSILAAIAVWSGVQFHRGGVRWKGRELPAARRRE